MIPTHYFEVICCPRCRDELLQTTEDRVRCRNCNFEYCVINDIPVLLGKSDTYISEQAQQFYEVGWQRNKEGRLKADLQHLDTSDLGKRYVSVNEARFESWFAKFPGKYFLDSGCGAHPRASFGKNHKYHVCVDLSVEGLLECKSLLGNRGIYIAGSLLTLPLRSAICDSVLVCHCLYHIQDTLQPQAIAECARVLREQGQMMIFYANPKSLEDSLAGILRRQMPRLVRAIRRSQNQSKVQRDLYYCALSIPTMLKVLGKHFDINSYKVKPLRMFSRRISEPIFCLFIGPFMYHLFRATEHVISGYWGSRLAKYVCYLGQKQPR